MNTRVRADALHVGLMIYIAMLLRADAWFASVHAQYGLAVVTWAFFVVWLRAFDARERRDAWLCIGVSTLVEYACTQAWGLYHYRFGNVPMYVPPGHGLIFLLGLSFARQPWVIRRTRALAVGTLVVATAWCVASLTVLARRSGHLDVHGAMYWPFFVYYLLTKKNAPVYIATFAITSWIELLGVRWETWHWATTVPGLGMSSADPPALIAGGYCAFGELALAIGRALDSRRARNRVVPVVRA